MTALCAALILMGGFSVPAYAQGTAAEPPTEDATNDSNVVVEEPETPPLTPKGNATLVDDFGGNKQLITVTTKGGNYFYILIDRAAEGEQTVHFLNQVDEAEVTALIGIVLMVVNKVDRTKNDMVMDMPFVYVGSQDVFMLSLCYRVGKLFSDCVGFLTVHLSRFKRLYQMKG